MSRNDLAVEKVSRGGFIIMKNDYESLTPTKWRCQYHIVASLQSKVLSVRGGSDLRHGKNNPIHKCSLPPLLDKV